MNLIFSILNPHVFLSFPFSTLPSSVHFYEVGCLEPRGERVRVYCDLCTTCNSFIEKYLKQGFHPWLDDTQVCNMHLFQEI